MCSVAQGRTPLVGTVTPLENPLARSSMPHCRPIGLPLTTPFAVASAITAWTTIRSLLVDPVSPLDIVPSMTFVVTLAPLKAGPSWPTNFV